MAGHAKRPKPSLQSRLTRPVRRSNHFLTLGFLAPEFRTMLREPWTDRDQQRFERFLQAAIRLDRALPAVVRHGVLNLYELDVKRRIRHKRAII
jgi:uncharacterized protein (DUF2236 family)